MVPRTTGRFAPHGSLSMDSTICSTSPESAATGAQFPVPVGANDLPELQSAGARLAFAVTADRKLVTANKGQLENDQFQGFWICERCGRAALEQPADAPHDRPYSIEYSFSLPRPPRHCDGTFQNVFLGHVFATDLLLLRLTLSPDMATDTNSLVVLRALEDGLYSIAEALRLAASRHPQLAGWDFRKGQEAFAEAKRQIDSLLWG